MRKIACVFSFRESSWVSCQKIVFNLHKAYERVPGIDIKNFHYGTDFHSFEVQDLADNLLEWNPEAIVFLDHRPHPYFIMKLLAPHYEGKKQKPRIIFHVFGDFTLWYKDWAALGFLLKDYPVEFIVASDRQKLLIDKFLAPHTESVVVPFPVRKEDFSFHPEERAAQRKAWNVGDDDVIFTFTGRISRQKRTHKLIEYFHEALQKETSRRAHLYIYGLPDNVGDHFLNTWDNENEYFRKVHRAYMALPESTRSRIHFMGSVPNKELRSVYAGADYLINLSVHNDEDFGMSVAEAQMTGLPAILTDWGGLAGFFHPELPDATRFISVKIGESSKIISRKQTVDAICDVIRNPGTVDRKKLIALAYDRLSVNAAGDLLIEIVEGQSKPFVSFSDLHEIITNRLQLGKVVYLTTDYKIHPLYRKLYSAYVRNP